MCHFQTWSRELVLELRTHASVAAKTHLPPAPAPVTADRASPTGSEHPCRCGLLDALGLGSLVLPPCHLAGATLGSCLLLLDSALAGGIQRGVRRVQSSPLEMVLTPIMRASSRAVSPTVATPRFSNARESTTLVSSGRSRVGLKAFVTSRGVKQHFSEWYAAASYTSRLLVTDITASNTYSSFPVRQNQ